MRTREGRSIKSKSIHRACDNCVTCCYQDKDCISGICFTNSRRHNIERAALLYSENFIQTRFSPLQVDSINVHFSVLIVNIIAIVLRITFPIYNSYYYDLRERKEETDNIGSIAIEIYRRWWNRLYTGRESDFFSDLSPFQIQVRSMRKGQPLCAREKRISLELNN